MGILDKVKSAQTLFEEAFGLSKETSDITCRISAKAGSEDSVYGPRSTANILMPLINADGLRFPYTPSVSFGGTTEYDTYNFTHSIYKYNSYARSYPSSIEIRGVFTAQTEDDANYVLAVMHFLKSVGKSYFGTTNTAKAGTPPPVLHFNYLGDNQFKNVPVILSNYSYELPMDVDYVPVYVSGGISGEPRSSWVPAHIEISITLETYYNPKMLRDEFDLDKFKEGKLLGSTNGTNEGFI